MSLRVLCSLVAVGLFTAVVTDVRAQGDDLGRFVEKNRILAQKVKTEVTSAMAQARALQNTDTEQAKTILQNALKQVQSSTALSANEQTQLTGQLLGRIREVGEIARQQRVAQKQAPLKELPARPDEKPRTGPGDIAQKFIEKGQAGTNAHSRLIEDRNKGFSGAMNSVASSAVATNRDVTFPKDWAAKSKLREKYTGPQLTAKEVALVKALNSVLSVDYQEKPFKEVLEDIQKRTGQNIIVDPNSLKESNTDYSDPVTLQLKKVQVRTLLRKVLRDNGLTFVIKDATIEVVTPAKAREMMVVRTYPINDIAAPLGWANRFGPFIQRAQMLANVQSLINSIKTTVEPSLWQEEGGGSIQFYEPGMSLIIRAPTEFHYQMGGAFGGSGR